MLQIIPIPAFKDNYIWLLANPLSACAIVVDPGDAEPVLNALEHYSLKLSAILITHHHHDHCGGVDELIRTFSVPVYGSAFEQINGLTHKLKEEGEIIIKELGAKFRVLFIPGHTLGHMAFHGEGILFCGDTLFGGGCGRLFEGTAQQMHHSLKKLAALPDNTLVYCGHEYTKNNLQFALTVEPTNRELHRRQTYVLSQLARGLPTLPSTIQLERHTNPFLRCEQRSIWLAAEQYAKQNFASSDEVFAVLRAWKDGFKTAL